MTTEIRHAVTAPLQNQTIHRTVLDNGIVVLVAENPAADIIAARILYEPVVVRTRTGWVGICWLQS